MQVIIASKKLKFGRPNVVLIVIDDYGYNDVGYHQNIIKTPNIDAISANGVRLENYYVQPICTPSRSQLMSGRYQIHTGLQHQLIWMGMPSALPLDTELLPEAMRNCGYSTMAAGKWHLGFAKSANTPWGRGFQNFTGYLGGSEDYYKKNRCVGHVCGIDQNTDGERVGERVYAADRSEYSAFKYIRQAQTYIDNRDKKKPFFLYLPMQSVHAPLEAPESYIHPYEKIIEDGPRRKYAGMVSVMDEGIGNITNHLKSEGLWNDTILIFTTDNGGQAYVGGNNLPFRGNKGGYWEGGIHGLGFVAGGYFERRKQQQFVNKELIHISDWFPTILEASGCHQSSQAPPLDGVSQWKTLVDLKASARQEILHNIDEMTVAHGSDRRNFTSNFNISVQATIRWNNWKLLTGDPGYPDYPINIPPQESGPQWTLNLGYPIPPRPIPLERLVRLFDIEKDPTEEHDVSDDHLDVVEFLLDRLVYWNSTQVPINFPPVDPMSSPDYHNGYWKPWLG